MDTVNVNLDRATLADMFETIEVDALETRHDAWAYDRDIWKGIERDCANQSFYWSDETKSFCGMYYASFLFDGIEVR